MASCVTAEPAECEASRAVRMQHQRVDGGIHGVEDPAEPCDEQDEPLVPTNSMTQGTGVHARSVNRRSRAGKQKRQFPEGVRAYRTPEENPRLRVDVAER
jgi:hypothetical protein